MREELEYDERKLVVGFPRVYGIEGNNRALKRELSRGDMACLVRMVCLLCAQEEIGLVLFI